MISAIEGGSVGYIKVAHKLRKVTFGCGYQKMEMVGHTHICKKRYIVDI
jgi:hypothetical protein